MTSAGPVILAVIGLVVAFTVFLGTLAAFGAYVPKRERTGLRFQETKGWWIAPTMDPVAWLRSLPILEASGAVLYLEGAHDPTVVQFLKERRYPNPTAVGPLTVWPRQPFHHLAATPEHLEGLADLVQANDVERLAYHAVLYRDGRLLLEWYEAFCPANEQAVFVKGKIITPAESRMYASLELPEDRVREFAAALGVAYGPRDESGDLPSSGQPSASP